jgi:hypothetical protein
VHFKQLFLLDGRAKRTNFTPEDEERTKLIAWLLQDWGLVKIKTPYTVNQTSDVVVISYSEKPHWNCASKYTIGNKRKIHQQNEVTE